MLQIFAKEMAGIIIYYMTKLPPPILCGQSMGIFDLFQQNKKHKYHQTTLFLYSTMYLEQIIAKFTRNKDFCGQT